MMMAKTSNPMSSLAKGEDSISRKNTVLMVGRNGAFPKENIDFDAAH
jgi:hypothetical protein